MVVAYYHYHHLTAIREMVNGLDSMCEPNAFIHSLVQMNSTSCSEGCACLLKSRVSMNHPKCFGLGKTSTLLLLNLHVHFGSPVQPFSKRFCSQGHCSVFFKAASPFRAQPVVDSFVGEHQWIWTNRVFSQVTPEAKGMQLSESPS